MPHIGRARRFIVVTGLLGTLALAGAAQVAPPQPPPRAQSEVEVIIGGEIGAPPRYAVPDLIPLTREPDTLAAAQAIAQVLWNDLAFEREFYMIPRDTYATIPAPKSLVDVPFDRWRELGTDGLVLGTVAESGETLRVEIRLFNVRHRQSVFAKEYTGTASNPRIYAHTAADELHLQQRGLRGVARTKLTFSSDRDGERARGTVEPRTIKEIYIADYDGENARRVTVNRVLNITPVWSMDAGAIAYTSYRRGYPDLVISFIYQGTMETPTAGGGHNWLPAYAPDGTRIAFVSNRDGNPEVYVMNRDGSGIRRVTFHPGIDSTPTWSPTGTEIAFTSDRSGSPQIYVAGADGLNVRRITSEAYCDRATWAPAPFNEIAYASRTGPGYDIRIADLATGERRQLTFAEGSNESPAYAPNGRHLAFTSTRSGRAQLFTIGRDGKGLRQVTRAGSNFTPNWSR